MPGFGGLSSDQVTSLVKYIRGIEKVDTEGHGRLGICGGICGREDRRDRDDNPFGAVATSMVTYTAG